jgi:hypothetical protein
MKSGGGSGNLAASALLSSRELITYRRVRARYRDSIASNSRAEAQRPLAVQVVEDEQRLVDLHPRGVVRGSCASTAPSHYHDACREIDAA